MRQSEGKVCGETSTEIFREGNFFGPERASGFNIPNVFFCVKFCLRFSYVSYVKSNFLVSHFFLDLNFYQLQLLREVLDWVDLEFTETAFRPGQADIVMMSDVSPHQKSDVKVGESYESYGEKRCWGWFVEFFLGFRHLDEALTPERCCVFTQA